MCRESPLIPSRCIWPVRGVIAPSGFGRGNPPRGVGVGVVEVVMPVQVEVGAV